MDSRWRFAVGTVLTIRHQGRGINGGRDTGYLSTSRSNVEESTFSRSRTNRSTRSYRELGFPRKKSTRLLRSRLRLQATSIIHLTEHGPFKRDHGTSSKSQRSVKRYSRRANARTTGAPARQRAARKTISARTDLEWPRRLTNGGGRKKRVFKKCLDKPCSVVPNGSAKSSSSAAPLVSTVIARDTRSTTRKDLHNINEVARCDIRG